MMKRKIKSGVIANAKMEFQEYRKTGEWLNTAVPFDHAFKINDENKERLLPIFESCNFSTRKEIRRAFEILIANLLECGRKRPVFLSRSPNEWTKMRYRRAGQSSIKIMDRLYSRGWIDMKKGFHNEEKREESRMSRIWATAKLLSYFRELPNAVMYDPVQLVELKDENGDLKEYTDTPKTRRIKSILQKANRVNQSVDIRYRKYKLNAFLVAIFNRDFNLYGRLHTRGDRHHYQGLSGEDRKEITINGDSVTELDFSGLHPRLLYAKEGIPFKDDPYSIVNGEPDARPFLKKVLIFMLNSKDETAAERAGNYWLYRNHAERERLKEIGITKARPIIDAFYAAHKPIDQYFCSGKDTGLKIMNLDATIALDIVKHFTSKNIPILAVHDSFIVQAEHRAELKQTMEKMYRKHTGFDCPVKLEY